MFRNLRVGLDTQAKQNSPPHSQGTRQIPSQERAAAYASSRKCTIDLSICGDCRGFRIFSEIILVPLKNVAQTHYLRFGQVLEFADVVSFLMLKL